MIKVTRLNKTSFILNHALIKYVECRPDTTITLVNDEKVVILEPVEDLIDEVIKFERQVRMFRSE